MHNKYFFKDIAPINKDWTPQDSFYFREMVVEKQFVSQIVEIKQDRENPNHISLGLILVDTSTHEDIYVHQVLIDKGMAISTK